MRCLHGKSDPLASSGELLSVDFPYGTGVFMIMWDDPTAARPRRAKVVGVKCILIVFVPDELGAFVMLSECGFSLDMLFDLRWYCDAMLAMYESLGGLYLRKKIWSQS